MLQITPNSSEYGQPLPEALRESDPDRYFVETNLTAIQSELAGLKYYKRWPDGLEQTDLIPIEMNGNVDQCYLLVHEPTCMSKEEQEMFGFDSEAEITDVIALSLDGNLLFNSYQESEEGVYMPPWGIGAPKHIPNQQLPGAKEALFRPVWRSPKQIELQTFLAHFKYR